jgi:hypothetical protein
VSDPQRCPFCAAEAIAWQHDTFGWIVYCSACAATGPHHRGDTREEAIAKWNERKMEVKA